MRCFNFVQFWWNSNIRGNNLNPLNAATLFSLPLSIRIFSSSYSLGSSNLPATRSVNWLSLLWHILLASVSFFRYSTDLSVSILLSRELARKLWSIHPTTYRAQFQDGINCTRTQGHSPETLSVWHHHAHHSLNWSSPERPGRRCISLNKIIKIQNSLKIESTFPTWPTTENTKHLTQLSRFISLKIYTNFTKVNKI